MKIYCRVCKEFLLEHTDSKQIEFHKRDISPHNPCGITVAEIYMCRQCADRLTGKQDKNDP